MSKWKNIKINDYIYSGKLIEYGQPVEGSIEWEVKEITEKKIKYLSGIYVNVKNYTYGEYNFFLPSWKLNDNNPHAVYFNNEDKTKKYLTIISL